MSSFWKEYNDQFLISDDELTPKTGKANGDLKVEKFPNETSSSLVKMNDTKLIESKVDNIAETLLRLNNFVSKFEEKDMKLQHPMSPSARSNESVHHQTKAKYSTIGAIPNLHEFPTHENPSHRPNIDRLIKVFSRPQTKFTGS